MSHVADCSAPGIIWAEVTAPAMTNARLGVTGCL